MILRRIATALRKQDWFTVVIETLIVVFGVFIGLQVNNWNEARSAARVEVELLTTLERDFAELEIQLNDRIEEVIDLQKNVSKLLDIVRADIEPEDDDAVIALLDSAWSLPILPSPPASYAEGVSAGRLSTLSDPDIRRALSLYGRQIEMYNLAVPRMAADIGARDTLVFQALRITNNLDVARLNKDGGIEGYDWDILKEADKDVEMVLVWMLVAEQLARGQLQEVETILTLLRKDASP